MWTAFGYPSPIYAIGKARNMGLCKLKRTSLFGSGYLEISPGRHQKPDLRDSRSSLDQHSPQPSQQLCLGHVMSMENVPHRQPPAKTPRPMEFDLAHDLRHNNRLNPQSGAPWGSGAASPVRLPLPRGGSRSVSSFPQICFQHMEEDRKSPGT